MRPVSVQSQAPEDGNVADVTASGQAYDFLKKTALIPLSAISRDSQGQFLHVLVTELQHLCLFP